MKALLALALAASAQAQTVDLLALHERAQAASPRLLMAQAARGEQQAGLRAAQAGLGPQLDARWDHGSQRQGALQFSQPLLNAPAWQQRDAARQRLQSREAELLASEQQLRQTSGQLYLQWHAQAQTWQVQTQLARAYADEAQRMGVRHREGLAAAVDWRQSQSFQWLAEAAARGGQQGLSAVRQQLVAHAGDNALAQAPMRPLRHGALPPLLDAAEGAPPRRAALQAERDARERELAAARQSRWPRLSLQAQALRDLQSRPSHERSWALQLRIPLWDSGSRGAALDAAQQRLRAQDAELQQLERELQRERATQAERLQAAREQHATAVGALAAAEQTVAAMRVGQEQGSRSTADVLLALQTLSQLRSLAVQAQAEAWLAWIELLVAQGRFDDAALRQLNQELEG